MEDLRVDKLKRDSKKILSYFKEVKNTIITTQPIQIVFPARFIDLKLAKIDGLVDVVGYYAILDDKGNYAVVIAPVIGKYSPDLISYVMIDNEKTALPHFGTSRADIVYEMMNSTLNDRVTRFMCIIKDYNSLSQIGSIRSVRTTNLQISPEYNSIVIHDGGPLYINAYFEAPYVEHLSGGFARIKNGKPTEFTEYITEGEVVSRCKKEGIGLEYNEYYQGSHWQFAKPNKQTDLSKRDDSFDALNIELPYNHNKPKLEYIPETGVYRYSEYGQEYIDALTDEHMEFKNVIIQESTFTQFDEHGYMNFWIHDNENMHGYYLTGGKAIPITWAKDKYDMFPTQFYVADGTMIQMNIGKTYICIVPDDSWDKIVIN